MIILIINIITITWFGSGLLSILFYRKDIRYHWLENRHNKNIDIILAFIIIFCFHIMLGIGGLYLGFKKALSRARKKRNLIRSIKQQAKDHGFEIKDIKITYYNEEE